MLLFILVSIHQMRTFSVWITQLLLPLPLSLTHTTTVTVTVIATISHSHFHYHLLTLHPYTHNHSHYHSLTLPLTPTTHSVAAGRRGTVGLYNLGNSCYMSSSLQCLSNVFPLTAYFLSDRYVPHINVISKDSTGGKLVSNSTLLFGLLLWYDIIE